MASQNEIELTLQQLMKASYGKLLSQLCVRTNDVEACEDVLSQAFSSAIELWKQTSIPEKPESWIFQVAKNKLIDIKRRENRFAKMEADIYLSIEELAHHEFDFFKDERLKLLFVCAHPAIDETIRTPLMLQTVLGLDSSQIASAFLTSPAAMSKKLVRAKQKIKLAKIDFSIPSIDQLFERTESVVEAIYAIYGKSWEHHNSEDSLNCDFNLEAIYLSELLTQLLPNQPEAKGLFAFLLFCESRKKARLSADGKYIPLDEQDLKLWNTQFISQADQLLQEAFSFGHIGRFQIEAAIQSAHTARLLFKIDNWSAILHLYESLITMAPTVGAYVSRAGALARLHNPKEGLVALDQISIDLVRHYQPYWALKADLLFQLSYFDLADSAYDLAIGLSQSHSVRNFLRKMKNRVRL